MARKFKRVKRLNRRERLELLVASVTMVIVSLVSTFVVLASEPPKANIISESKEIPSKVVEEVTEPSYNEEDLWWLSHVIYSENGNQDYHTLVMTGAVVLNRVNDPRFPDTIKEVVTQKTGNTYQFDVVRNGTINLEPSEDAIRAAKEVLDGKQVLPNDVLYFAASSCFDNKVGASWWGNEVRTYAVIGGVVFAQQKI